MSERNVHRMVKRRAHKAGLSDRVTCHSLRRTGITLYLKNQGSLEHAQRIAGHASPRTIKLYDRRSEEVAFDEILKINLA